LLRTKLDPKSHRGQDARDQPATPLRGLEPEHDSTVRREVPGWKGFACCSKRGQEASEPDCVLLAFSLVFGLDSGFDSVFLESFLESVFDDVFSDLAGALESVA